MLWHVLYLCFWFNHFVVGYIITQEENRWDSEKMGNFWVQTFANLLKDKSDSGNKIEFIWEEQRNYNLGQAICGEA